MNRRQFFLASMATGMLPGIAAAQTPMATPGETPIDTRARDLLAALQAVSPVDLITALELAPVTQANLQDAADGSAVAMPWADFGDTDLYSSLGGIAIVAGGGSVDGPDTEMIGAYIVYESAEIAYQEFIRKMGAAYDNPSLTQSLAGTNVWVFDSDDLQLGVARIGYVMLTANLTESDTVFEGLIEHLTEVATAVVS